MTCTKTTHDVCTKMHDEVSYVANRMYFLVDRIDSDSLRSDFKYYIRRLNDLVENISLIPRNCDLYSHDDALRIWNSLPDSRENGWFDEWLYAEAKGEAK